jgi:hypothetical protein
MRMHKVSFDCWDDKLQRSQNVGILEVAIDNADNTMHMSTMWMISEAPYRTGHDQAWRFLTFKPLAIP